jgi:hypothetical protein
MSLQTCKCTRNGEQAVKTRQKGRAVSGRQHITDKVFPNLLCPGSVAFSETVTSAYLEHGTIAKTVYYLLL